MTENHVHLQPQMDEPAYGTRAGAVIILLGKWFHTKKQRRARVSEADLLKLKCNVVTTKVSITQSPFFFF